MEHISDVLSGIIETLSKKENDSPADIGTVWRETVGETIARHTKPYRIRKNVLYVAVDSATWVYELSQKYKAALLQKLNEQKMNGTLEDIYFRVGDIG